MCNKQFDLEKSVRDGTFSLTREKITMNKNKMIDSIIIKHLENGTFRETTIYKDGTSLIEIFDDGILISSEEVPAYDGPPKILTDMLKNIKPIQQLQLQTYEDDNIDHEFVDARQFFWRLIRKHNS